jgi:hypothetical protein
MVWEFCYLRIFKKMHSISGRCLHDKHVRLCAIREDRDASLI